MGKLSLSERTDKVKRVSDRVADLNRRANEGDAAALESIREMVQSAPSLMKVIDLAAVARGQLVKKAVGDDVTACESLLHFLEVMRAELAGPNPVALERLLADRIVSAWLYLHYLEAMAVPAELKGMRVASHCQKQIDRAQGRYLAAIRSLASVRKLAGLCLQVNIADRQVNFAGNAVD
ncbi:MAG: hypothetical protein K1X57_19020 [Gemmataceae bacterium]|nr:hypothetical protein [Gemmataceae bacterium]